MLPELRFAWVRKDDRNKKRVIAQFKEPITKNRQLIVYEVDAVHIDHKLGKRNTRNTMVLSSDGGMMFRKRNQMRNLIFQHTHRLPFHH